MKRTIATLVAAALAFALCPAGVALADDAAIESVKTKIEAIQNVNPLELDASDTETIGAINEAQTAFNSLSQEDQDVLDNTALGKQSYGRVLESAVWSIGLTVATNNATDLPNGSYPEGVASQSDKGKYVVTTVRTWSVSNVVVRGGKAYGTVFCNETGNYPNMRIGNVVYEGIVEADENGKNHSRYENIPIELGATMSFAVTSSFAGAVVYQITTTLDNAVIDTWAKANTDAAKAIALIDALPATITLGSLSAVEAAVDELAALSNEAKSLVPQSAIDKLAKAVNTLDALVKAQQKAAAQAKADASAAAKVTAKIKALPKTVVDTDKKAVAAARTAYNALNANAKKLVTNYKTLTAAEKAVKSTKTINTATVTSKLVKKAAKKGITAIVLGSKVKTVKSKAFASAKKVKTLVVTSKKLKKAKVKNSLKSSKITTVKVPKSKKSAYKKIFTKKVCGKKVTLKTL